MSFEEGIPTCDGCQYQHENLILEDSPFRPFSEKRLQLCYLCMGTLAGNAAAYPAQYHDSRAVLQAISYVGNVLIEVMREHAERTER